MKLVSNYTARSWMQLVALVGLATTTVTMAVYWLNWTNVIWEHSSEMSTLLNHMEIALPRINVKLKTILFWKLHMNRPNYGMGDGSGQEIFIQANCSINTCFGTTNRTLIPVEDFDAIMFYTFSWETFPHSRPFSLKKVSPVRRKPSQRYINYLMEPPGNVGGGLKYLTNFFNWSMTYRWDSDILKLHSWIIPIDSPEQTPPNPNPVWLKPDLDFKDSSKLKLVSQKTKLVAWFVSNCHSFSKREAYVKELSKYIVVDIYGRCGSKSCSKSYGEKCNKMLNANYKFYLSMENSLCKDYVTEKLFRTMKYDVVPVVYGAANYSKHVPPMSYINAFDFGSARELADYLVYLDQNHEEYVKYFWWKQHYKVTTYRSGALCKLCEMLHQDLIPKSCPDIYKWWSGSGVCVKPSDLYKKHKTLK